MNAEQPFSVTFNANDTLAMSVSTERVHRKNASQPRQSEHLLVQVQIKCFNAVDSGRQFIDKEYKYK